MMESSQLATGAGQTSSRSDMPIREMNNELEHEQMNQYQDGEFTRTTRGYPTDNTTVGNSDSTNRHQSRRRGDFTIHSSSGNH
jgi:hypothetical protein